VLAGDPVLEPAVGAERFDWDPFAHAWRSAWTRNDVVSTSTLRTMSRSVRYRFRQWPYEARRLGGHGHGFAVQQHRRSDPRQGAIVVFHGELFECPLGAGFDAAEPALPRTGQPPPVCRFWVTRARREDYAWRARSTSALNIAGRTSRNGCPGLKVTTLVPGDTRRTASENCSGVPLCDSRNVDESQPPLKA